jgi:hypothetical protein
MNNKSCNDKMAAHRYIVTSMLLKPLKQLLSDVTSSKLY